MALHGYHFEIPIPQWESYRKHIIYGMYHIKEGAFKIIGDANGIRRIEAKANPQWPLISSLPETICDLKLLHYSKDEILDRVQDAIQACLDDYFRPGGTYYEKSDIIEISESELPLIIKQLAAYKYITRFTELDQGRWIIYSHPEQTEDLHPMTMILKVVNGSLMISIFSEMYRFTFDVDDGYNGSILKPLNHYWEQWTEKGDVTAPIQPPNHV